MDNICICIPARYKSSRLEGKMLMKIGEDSIIVRTCKKSLETKIKKIYVLTDHIDIFNEIKNNFTLNEVEPMITPNNIENGSSRISWALNNNLIDEKYDIIVNIQGDEPFINPYNIDHAISLHILYNKNKENVFYTTLHDKCNDINYVKSNSSVKLVIDKNNRVIYYSRSIIPCSKNNTYKSEYDIFTGIYVYNRDKIKSLDKLEKCELYSIEDIEQLNILYNGYYIMSYPTIYPNEISINTLEDYNYICNKYK